MGLILRKQREPKKFSLQHRIYDERKAELDLKRKQLSDVELIKEDKDAYRERMRERIGRTRVDRKSTMKQNLRIFILFAAMAAGLTLVLGFYYLADLFRLLLENSDK